MTIYTPSGHIQLPPKELIMKLTSQDSYCALQSRSNVITKQHIRKEKTFEHFKNLNSSY